MLDRSEIYAKVLKLFQDLKIAISAAEKNSITGERDGFQISADFSGDMVVITGSKKGELHLDFRLPFSMKLEDNLEMTFNSNEAWELLEQFTYYFSSPKYSVLN